MYRVRPGPEMRCGVGAIFLCRSRTFKRWLFGEEGVVGCRILPFPTGIRLLHGWLGELPFCPFVDLLSAGFYPLHSQRVCQLLPQCGAAGDGGLAR